MRASHDRLPVPGDLVGLYRVVAPLGRGGQGYVYQAECAGRLFVLKFFESHPASPWGELEIDILRHLDHPNVVRVLGYGRWPDPERGSLYIVMEYVEGLMLEAHALEHNPSARQAANLLLKAARALAVVHRQGVLHRDVKPDNLLVRKTDGEPVWVDFGVGHLEGRTTPPGLSRLPPGTPEFISPEAWRFLQEHREEEVRYRPGVADEVWAFGVTAYWLLTDELPFGTREGSPHLGKRIRTRIPAAPHEDNPRVPVALSAVCLRMLEKEPGARLADLEAVAADLEAAMAGADSGWDVPLLDPDAPQRRTTEELPGKVVDRDTWERFKQECKVSAPRRGRVRKARRKPPPSRELEPDPRPGAAAVAVRPRRVVSVALVTVLLGALLLVRPWTSNDSPAPGATATSAPTAGVTPQPPRWRVDNPARYALFGGELAMSREPSKAEAGAALFLTPTPAPDSATMLRKTDARSKPEKKSAPKLRRKAPGCVPLVQETCVAGICTLLLTGCTGTPQVVRPAPKPAECPPDAVRTMTEELGIHIGQEELVTFPKEGNAQPVTVRESSPVTLLDYFGKLPPGTLLSGPLYIGTERVYGRFTQARKRNGQTFPVCIELLHMSTPARGAERDDVGGPADSAVIWSTNTIEAVDHFE